MAYKVLLEEKAPKQVAKLDAEVKPRILDALKELEKGECCQEFVGWKSAETKLDPTVTCVVISLSLCRVSVSDKLAEY